MSIGSRPRDWDPRPGYSFLDDDTRTRFDRHLVQPPRSWPLSPGGRIANTSAARRAVRTPSEVRPGTLVRSSEVFKSGISGTRASPVPVHATHTGVVRPRRGRSRSVRSAGYDVGKPAGSARTSSGRSGSVKDDPARMARAYRPMIRPVHSNVVEHGHPFATEHRQSARENLNSSSFLRPDPPRTGAGRMWGRRSGGPAAAGSGCHFAGGHA